MSNILFFCNYKVAQPACGGIIRVTGTLSNIFSQQGHSCFLCYYFNLEGILDGSFKESIILEPHNEKGSLTEFISHNQIDNIILQVPLNNTNWYLLPMLRDVIYHTPHHCKLIHCIHTIPFAECKGFDFSYLRYMIRQNEPLSHKLKKMTWAMICIIAPQITIFKTKHRYDYICKYCDRVVLLSERYIPFFIEHVKCAKEQILGINNPQTFSHRLEQQDIAHKEKIALFVGRLDESTKRLSRAIRIWSDIEHKYCIHNWSFVIVGEGTDMDHYKQLAANYKISNITFTGKQSPSEFYKKASIFMLSSAIEGLPMAVIESKQMGCIPISLNSFDAIYDLITDSYDGYIVDNIEDYSKKLAYLMTHDKVRIELMEHCLQNCNSFNPDVVYEQWKHIIS